MMLAYAANRPPAGKRQSSPNAMLLVISAHVALLAVVMSAKMDLPRRIQHGPPLIDITLSPPPPPIHAAPPRGTKTQQTATLVDNPDQTIKLPSVDPTPYPINPNPPDATVIGGGGVATLPVIPPPPVVAPIRHDPRLLTPMSELKPPYPASKLASEEEATLKLRLTIDDRGRVIAVEPVGHADREFLDAARRYLIAHWRYDPATEDGRPISTTTVITLRFRLDG
jgi:protein TonB